jgi:hypothetical protein
MVQFDIRRRVVNTWKGTLVSKVADGINKYFSGN